MGAILKLWGQDAPKNGGKMKLSDKACKAAKAKETAYKIFDGSGLFLEVMPNGSKLWRLKYRYLGKEKRISLGAYPIISLADARDGRDKAKKQLIQGIDPSGAKQAQKRDAIRNAENTFKAIALEWHEKQLARWTGGSRAWRPNPSFPEHDYERVVEAAAVHGMSVGSFIVALCQAYVYCSPFILKQHLRPSMPPMTAEEHRTCINVANNLNQIARAMNEARKIALDHGTTYPPPPEELGPLLQALYTLLKVEQ